jgi:hypothetical protein
MGPSAGAGETVAVAARVAAAATINAKFFMTPFFGAARNEQRDNHPASARNSGQTAPDFVYCRHYRSVAV